MQPTITSQLTGFEEYLRLKNFCSATKKMYLRTLKKFLRFAVGKYAHHPLSQDPAKH